MVEGLEDMGSGDMVTPRMRIVQPTSREVSDSKARPGEFYCNDGSVYQSINVVLLHIHHERALWEKGSDTPLCASDNGIEPSPRIEHPKATRCGFRNGDRIVDDCPMAVWGKKGSPPPACKRGYRLFAVNTDTGMPFIIQLAGSQVAKVRQLLTAANGARRPFFANACTISTTKETNDRGTFFVIAFSPLVAVEPADKYRAIAEGLRGYDIAKTYAAEEQQGGGEVAAPVDEDSIPF